MKASSVKAVLGHNITDFLSSYHTVLVEINFSKSLINCETLVAEKHLLGCLDSVLSPEDSLEETEEHVVLDAALLLLFGSLSLGSFEFLLLVLNLYFIFGVTLDTFFLCDGELLLVFSLTLSASSLIISLTLNASLFGNSTIFFNLSLTSFKSSLSFILSFSGSFSFRLSFVFDQLLDFSSIVSGRFLCGLSLLQLLGGDVLVGGWGSLNSDNSLWFNGGGVIFTDIKNFNTRSGI
jgi:hypothetical protein